MNAGLTECELNPPPNHDRPTPASNKGWGPWSSAEGGIYAPVELAEDETLRDPDHKQKERRSVVDDMRAHGADLSWLETLFEEISTVVERNRTGVAELFKQFDKRATGHIDKRDIHDTLKEAFGLSLEEEKLKVVLSEFDRDGNVSQPVLLLRSLESCRREGRPNSISVQPSIGVPLRCFQCSTLLPSLVRLLAC